MAILFKREQNRKHFRSIFFILIFLFISFQFIKLPVNAKTETNNKGLTLSPLRRELDIAPGTSQSGSLTVTNSTKTAITVNFSVEEFNVINQQYDYIFTAESDLTKWVTFSSNQISLEAGQSKEISFSVGVPLTAEPGGRYISLFASTDSMASDNSVNSRQRVASLLYITVLGDVTREGHLLSLNSPWLISGNSKWSALIQNKGSTHFRSRYDVTLQNIIGNGTIAKMSGDALILPGSVRLVTDDIIMPKLPGIYKVVYKIGLGDTPSKTQIRYFIYMPIYAIILCISIIAIIIIWFCRRKRTKKH